MVKYSVSSVGTVDSSFPWAYAQDMVSIAGVAFADSVSGIVDTDRVDSKATGREDADKTHKVDCAQTSHL